ncbi:MAG: PadR family transcriptional regulator [Planctomycetota bacterium]
MAAAPDNWITQVRKGVLELCVLNALRAGAKYGYDIVKSLRPVDALVVGEGTIYPILSRLRREGFLRSTIEESDAGPPRKYYALTTSGRSRLSAMNAYWKSLTDNIATLMRQTT